MYTIATIRSEIVTCNSSWYRWPEIAIWSSGPPRNRRATYTPYRIVVVTLRLHSSRSRRVRPTYPGRTPGGLCWPWSVPPSQVSSWPRFFSLPLRCPRPGTEHPRRTRRVPFPTAYWYIVGYTRMDTDNRRIL